MGTLSSLPLGGGPGRGRLAQRRGQRLPHPIHIPHHIVVPETHDTVAACLQPLRALCILDGLIGMPASIDLDDEALGFTEEIRNVGS